MTNSFISSSLLSLSVFSLVLNFSLISPPSLSVCSLFLHFSLLSLFVSVLSFFISHSFLLPLLSPPSLSVCSFFLPFSLISPLIPLSSLLVPLIVDCICSVARQQREIEPVVFSSLMRDSRYFAFQMNYMVSLLIAAHRSSLPNT